MTGEGEGNEGTPLARKPHDFKKLRSPTYAASDWRYAGSVDYLAFETRYALFSCVTDLVSSDLWSQITNALD